MGQIVTRNTQYGPEGQPYCVLVIHPAGTETRIWTWTADEACEIRDAAFDRGFQRVRIAGLPTTISW